MMFRHWQRHMASVPKGYLRNTILRMLSQKEMSGSEIMSAIEEETEGRWRPSPGSVYPLLAWFGDNGFIKETSKAEGGVKRYTLTEKGKKFLKEVKERRIEFHGPRFVVPPLMGWNGCVPPTEEDIKLRNSIGRLFANLIDYRRMMDVKYSKNKLDEISKIIEEASVKIEEIIKKDSGETSDDKSKN